MDNIIAEIATTELAVNNDKYRLLPVDFLNREVLLDDLDAVLDSVIEVHKYVGNVCNMEPNQDLYTINANSRAFEYKELLNEVGFLDDGGGVLKLKSRDLKALNTANTCVKKLKELLDSLKKLAEIAPPKKKTSKLNQDKNKYDSEPPKLKSESTTTTTTTTKLATNTDENNNIEVKHLSQTAELKTNMAEQNDILKSYIIVRSSSEDDSSIEVLNDLVSDVPYKSTDLNASKVQATTIPLENVSNETIVATTINSSATSAIASNNKDCSVAKNDLNKQQQPHATTQNLISHNVDVNASGALVLSNSEIFNKLKSNNSLVKANGYYKLLPLKLTEQSLVENKDGILVKLDKVLKYIKNAFSEAPDKSMLEIRDADMMQHKELFVCDVGYTKQADCLVFDSKCSAKARRYYEETKNDFDELVDYIKQLDATNVARKSVLLENKPVEKIAETKPVSGDNQNYTSVIKSLGDEDICTVIKEDKPIVETRNSNVGAALSNNSDLNKQNQMSASVLSNSEIFNKIKNNFFSQLNDQFKMLPLEFTQQSLFENKDAILTKLNQILKHIQNVCNDSPDEIKDADMMLHSEFWIHDIGYKRTDGRLVFDAKNKEKATEFYEDQGSEFLELIDCITKLDAPKVEKCAQNQEKSTSSIKINNFDDSLVFSNKIISETSQKRDIQINEQIKLEKEANSETKREEKIAKTTGKSYLNSTNFEWRPNEQQSVSNSQRIEKTATNSTAAAAAVVATPNKETIIDSNNASTIKSNTKMCPRCFYEGERSCDKCPKCGRVFKSRNRPNE